jgi:hypothetical protein
MKLSTIKVSDHAQKAISKIDFSNWIDSAMVDS